MFKVQILVLSEYASGSDVWETLNISHSFKDKDVAIEWGLVQTGRYCDDDSWSHKHLDFNIVEEPE